MKVKQEFIKPRLCDLCGHEGSWYITAHVRCWKFMALCDACKKGLGKRLIEDGKKRVEKNRKRAEVVNESV